MLINIPDTSRGLNVKHFEVEQEFAFTYTKIVGNITPSLVGRDIPGKIFVKGTQYNAHIIN